MLETLVLSILNHDCAIASAASRMVTAAGDRPLIEMGSRRTHELAAVASARAAYIAGFDFTSNLRAGHDYGVPTSGTARTRSRWCTTASGTRSAPRSTRSAPARPCWWTPTTWPPRCGPPSRWPAPTWARSGSTPATCLVVARQVRALLDALGADKTRIVVSGDLDEYSIAALAAAPVDGYGVGTSLVTGSGAPTAALVYKLVARADEPGAAAPLRAVAKRSVGKPGRRGRKWAVRSRDAAGTALAELITTVPADPGPDDRVLLRPLVRGGEIVGREPLDAARSRHREVKAELPAHALQLSRGYPAIPTVFTPDGD